MATTFLCIWWSEHSRHVKDHSSERKNPPSWTSEHKQDSGFQSLDWLAVRPTCTQLSSYYLHLLESGRDILSDATITNLIFHFKRISAVPSMCTMSTLYRGKKSRMVPNSQFSLSSFRKIYLTPGRERIADEIDASSARPSR